VRAALRRGGDSRSRSLSRVWIKRKIPLYTARIVPSTPYVVRTGEYLTAIASQCGSTVDDILADPNNADLKKLRANPEILAPTDIVYLPQAEPTWHALPVGSTTTFTAPDAPTVTLNVVLLGQDGQAIANKPVTTDPVVSESPLTTDGSGLLTFPITIDVDTIDVSVDGTCLRFRLRVGNLDPVDTDTGLASRLRHLGHLGDEDSHVIQRSWLRELGLGANDAGIALGVASFQAANGRDVTGDADDDVRGAIHDAHGC
jgi:hypothetical protein